MDVIISIRPDVDIADLEIATEHLNLHVDSSLFDKGNHFSVRNSTEFTTIQGNVSVAYWSSRDTTIDVVSGSISGTYALRDVLSIKTRSGSINVDVKPRAVDELAPAPADFVAATTSGSIVARFPIFGSVADIPEREYRTRTETNSGAISGTYILGSVSTFKTTSGSITADVLPYSADSYSSSLRTQTRSGHTNVNVLSPFVTGDRALSRLRSSHKSLSSGLTLKYPQEWEGLIAGGTLSGSLTVQGKDVRVLDLKKGPVGTKIRARKGYGQSRLDFSATSGSVDLIVGDLR